MYKCADLCVNLCVYVYAYIHVFSGYMCISAYNGVYTGGYMLICEDICVPYVCMYISVL